MINIQGLNKADVLKVLYNNSKPLGMGIFQYIPQDMETDDAEKILAQTTYFDYLFGRVMKVDLTSDIEFNEWGYDRDNGQGSAERVINSLRQ